MNLFYINEQKLFLQNLIESKLKFHKNITQDSNQSDNANQFWHRSDKVLENKKNKIVEPLYDSTTGRMCSKINSYLKNSITITSKTKSKVKLMATYLKLI